LDVYNEMQALTMLAHMYTLCLTHTGRVAKILNRRGLGYFPWLLQKHQKDPFYLGYSLLLQQSGARGSPPPFHPLTGVRVPTPLTSHCLKAANRARGPRPVRPFSLRDGTGRPRGAEGGPARRLSFGQPQGETKDGEDAQCNLTLSLTQRGKEVQETGAQERVEVKGGEIE